jgi:iron complex transport system substrate-binding protein
VGVALLLGGAAAAAGCGADETSVATGPREARTVTHALGVTDVPAAPERIVVLNPYSLLDYLLALGIRPVGSSGDPAADDPFARHLSDRTDGIAMVGPTESPNIERIAALEPDLILANPWQEDVYDRLSRIAPKVGVPLSYSDYEQELHDVAGLVGRGREAERLIEAHRERVTAFRRELGERLSRIEVSVARVFPGEIRVEGNSYVTRLMRAAGVRRPRGHDTRDGLTLSPEQLPRIDADVLLVYSAANASTEEENAMARARLAANPLWRKLRAVRAGQVHEVDSFVWGGGGIIWADRVLDDLAERLRGAAPAR